MSEQQSLTLQTNAPELLALAPTGDPITDMINRISSDPTASIETLERMIALRDKDRLDAAEREFNVAFANAQAGMPAVPKRGKSHVSNYALWEDVNARIIKVLSQHGLSISYTSSFSDSSVIVKATLRHSMGHSISGEFNAPIDTNKATNGSQARGSAMSYGKRYVTINLLSITTYGEDDDGFSIEASSATMETMEAIKSAATFEELAPIKTALMTDLKSNKDDVIAMKKAWAARNEELSMASSEAA